MGVNKKNNAYLENFPTQGHVLREPITTSPRSGSHVAKMVKRKGNAGADADNPEDLPSNPRNSLFGSKPVANVAAEAAEQPPPRAATKRPRTAVSKEDPAVAMVREAKRRKRAADASAAPSPKDTMAPAKATAAAAGSKAVRPHAAAVEQSNRMWEKLRSEKTEGMERAKLIDQVLELFAGKLLSVLQKHDAARVLQSCFKQGSAAQREVLMREIAGEASALARSHYGHFLLISILRHGTAAHRQQLCAELLPHVAELLVHAEGSAVLQLLYADVATGEQRNHMYRAMWGKEMALFGTDANVGQPSSLADLFEADPLCKERVLRRLETLLAKAARKGLAVTALVQRGAAEMLEHGDDAQRAELVSSFRDQAVHVMHTREGARIACGCMRYGDAKDRKAVLKAMKGYVARAALDSHGALVLCVALEVADDTVLLSKAVLSELLPELAELALHAQGSLPLLQLLSPRSSKHFSPAQLATMGLHDAAASKKDPTQRRSELLATLLPPLLRLCAAQPAALACSPHGAAVLFEALRVAAGGDELHLDAAVTELVVPTFEALAAVVLEVPASDAAYPVALVVHPYGARLLKRLAQSHPAFATALLGQLSGALTKWALDGAGWVILALLESKATATQVRAELRGAVSKLAASSAPGCRSLSAQLPSDTEPTVVAKKKGKKKGA